MCTIDLKPCAPLGYELEGSCGERLTVGASELLVEARIPEGACPDFRARVLKAFGPGGERRLGKDLEEPYDGIPDLGRRSAKPLRGTVLEELRELLGERER